MVGYLEYHGGVQYRGRYREDCGIMSIMVHAGGYHFSHTYQFQFNLKSFIDTKLYKSMVKASKKEQEENAKNNSTAL